MYKIPDYKETDDVIVLSFLKANPFVTLIGYDGKHNVATQVPVLIDGENNNIKLRAHIMRNTDHHKAVVQNPDVLVLFHGPHCYVSSSWYTQKMGTTWNYQTVHVNGRVKLLDDAATIQILKELTEQYEREQENPLYMTEMPDGYVDKMVKAIAGIEITVNSIYPIFKLSQNRDDESYKSIVHHLSQKEDAHANAIAEEMKLRRGHLFK